MKIIVAGSRTIADSIYVEAAIASCKFNISEIVSGGARGVDKLGEQWAYEQGQPLTIFKADWDRYGKSAGYIRNMAMAGYADALVAVWDGKSKGTRNMIDEMKKLRKPIYIFYPREGK